MEYEDEVDFREVAKGLADQVKTTGVPMAIFKKPNGNILVKVPKEIKK